MQAIGVQEKAIRPGLRLASSTARPTYVRSTPPCQNECPAGHDVRGWFNVIRGIDRPPRGMVWQEYVWRKMVAANPFPAAMGRVCPAPCQDGCNRRAVDDFVGINACEQFIGDWALEHDLRLGDPRPDTGKRVAVVGGGVAGLSAAFGLRLRGHAVTVFEARPKLGGMLTYGLPAYRIPRAIVDAEIERILRLGIEARTATRVGRDIAIHELDDAYDAVFWALGSQSGRLLPGIGGADAENVVTAIEFLCAFNEGRLKAVPRHIVVIGGGDTSLDVACVSLRLGVLDGRCVPAEMAIRGVAEQCIPSKAARRLPEVLLTSLLPEHLAPAAPGEIAEAKREGVRFVGGVMPLEIVVDHGRATAVKLSRCVMDGPAPVPVPGSEWMQPVDLLVIAIGQTGDFTGLEALDSGGGLIAPGEGPGLKGLPGHFAGGDIVRPALLATAIGHGMAAAEAIDRHLSGADPNPTVVPQVIRSSELYLPGFKAEPRNRRVETWDGSGGVLGRFEERLRGLTQAQVVKEAGRCMSCGLCIECDDCIIYCPTKAVQRHPPRQRSPGRYVHTDQDACIGCQVCGQVCPTGYIRMRNPGVPDCNHDEA